MNEKQIENIKLNGARGALADAIRDALHNAKFALECAAKEQFKDYATSSPAVLHWMAEADQLFAEYRSISKACGNE